MKAIRFLYFDLNSKVIAANLSTKVTMKTTTFLTPCSSMSSALFYLFHCSLKEKDPIRTMINSAKKIFICVIIITINLPKIRVRALTTKNKLPSPKWYIVF